MKWSFLGLIGLAVFSFANAASLSHFEIVGYKIGDYTAKKKAAKVCEKREEGDKASCENEADNRNIFENIQYIYAQ